MRKKTRVAKAWQRNWDFYMHKGIYFIMGTPVKYWMTLNNFPNILKEKNKMASIIDP